MVAKFVERSFQRHRVFSISSSYERADHFEEFDQFYHFKRRESEGFERRRREEEEKKERRREEEEIKQGDHRGFSSGVIPFKLLVVVVEVVGVVKVVSCVVLLMLLKL
ncbi:hypothetical protein KY284_000411 [Solanum tuberosum]|nr:hypothetical protein KY284_000411 [Solanum tuberosum]